MLTGAITLAIYLVGDIQGCFKELQALLTQVNFSPKRDLLFVAGDLVARGPDSLATLRFIKSLGKRAKVVLGNHDLHLLAVYAGIKKAKAADKLAEVLNAPDVKELMDWLAQQPLIQEIPCTETQESQHKAFMSHAGFAPQWTLKEAQKQAKFVQKRLASKKREHWLSLMYGEEPNHWRHAESEEQKFRYSVNALTRMRYCYLDGSLEFVLKKAPEKNTHNELKPWFDLCKDLENVSWVFGHWASLMGKHKHNNLYALDTGCVWGNHLTILRWHDKKLFTQKALS